MLRWTLKFPKANTLADGLIERTLSMLDKHYQKLRKKKRTMIDRLNKIMSRVKPVENINENPQSFLEKSYLYKEVALHKLQDHAYE